MIRSDFGLDTFENGLVTFATKYRATVLVSSQGKFVAPDEVIPLASLLEERGGYVLVYRDPPQPVSFVTVRFKRFTDASGQDVPDWKATLVRDARFTGPATFDGAVEAIFPYSVSTVALYKALVDYGSEEFIYVLRKIKEPVIIKA